MPELPEVETITRRLRPEITGKTIRNVELRWERTLASPAPGEFVARIQGQKIRAISRRAKYLQMQLSRDFLLVHLRMSGDLTVSTGPVPAAKHDRLILRLSGNTTLAFNDPRKFGRIWLTPDAETVLSGLGPEPLAENFTPEWLYRALQGRRRQLKPLLLDQSFLAGLGNIYTDEALFLAKLHPLTRSHTLTERQARDLWAAIRTVLEEGIRRNGASIDWVYRGGDFQNHFQVYAQNGQNCQKCYTIIERIVIGQRSTHICPNCQQPGEL
ncbi:MAG: bifunctional DNA-formamidopyrimidine glycosylase/DNA-(apurinic or apyrimidinic site) lyase [Chloroflexota bacterium]